MCVHARQCSTMADETETYDLSREQELRIEVGHGQLVQVILQDGTAEIFGTEIAKGASVKLPGGKHALFTWSGASVDVKGLYEECYVASETPMVEYVNISSVLDERRNVAKSDSTKEMNGPRVALVGPTDVGKSTLCKLLCNYAVRKGWSPLFVDLDLGQNNIGPPSTIGAVQVDRALDATDGFVNLTDLPLVYFHGDTSPGNNPDLYKHLVEKLSTMVDQRGNTNPDSRSSGLVLNTMGWVDGAGYKLLLHALDAFKITDVLVVGQDKLHAGLARDFRGKTQFATKTPVQVWPVKKSGGVVERSPQFRRQTREAVIKSYFYGADGELSPSSTSIEFGKVSIFKIGSGPRAPSSALPIGQKTSADPLRVTTVAPSMALLNSVLAVSHGKTTGEIPNTNVAGFIFVTEVDMVNKKLTYMSPTGGGLPSRNLITGTLKWIET